MLYCFLLLIVFLIPEIENKINCAYELDQDNQNGIPKECEGDLCLISKRLRYNTTFGYTMAPFVLRDCVTGMKYWETGCYLDPRTKADNYTEESVNAYIPVLPTFKPYSEAIKSRQKAGKTIKSNVTDEIIWEVSNVTLPPVVVMDVGAGIGDGGAVLIGRGYCAFKQEPPGCKLQFLCKNSIDSNCVKECNYTGFGANYADCIFLDMAMTHQGVVKAFYAYRNGTAPYGTPMSRADNLAMRRGFHDFEHRVYPKCVQADHLMTRRQRLYVKTDMLLNCKTNPFYLRYPIPEMMVIPDECTPEHDLEKILCTRYVPPLETQNFLNLLELVGGAALTGLIVGIVVAFIVKRTRAYYWRLEHSPAKPGKSVLYSEQPASAAASTTSNAERSAADTSTFTPANTPDPAKTVDDVSVDTVEAAEPKTKSDREGPAPPEAANATGQPANKKAAKRRSDPKERVLDEVPSDHSKEESKSRAE
ncbi:unnamed protein product, partial [Mesorhabditis spiculigera]